MLGFMLGATLGVGAEVGDMVGLGAGLEGAPEAQRSHPLYCATLLSSGPLPVSVWPHASEACTPVASSDGYVVEMGAVVSSGEWWARSRKQGVVSSE